MGAPTTGAWQDQLRSELAACFGAADGERLSARYADAFPAGYQDVFSPSQAVADIPSLEGVRSDAVPLLTLLPSTGNRVPEGVRLALLWSGHRPALLADVFPVLDHLGLRIADHQPFDIRPAAREPIRMEEFQLLPRDGKLVGAPEAQVLLEHAFRAVWSGEADDDGFNRLVLRAGLDWRSVALLRGIYAYLRQAGCTFSQAHVERTLVAHQDVARLLVDLFLARFDPDSAGSGREAEARAALEAALKAVDNLNEDRVLRAGLEFVEGTVRTNYFQHGPDQSAKPYLVCKLDPASLPFLPTPRPYAETFVYSPRLEGVHLRATRVARGGIRWSDRSEDYRTEVLALLKAQMVKNAIIVPHGAKGAFVVKHPPSGADEDALADEVRYCYATFIRGLLDITDNRVERTIKAPPDTVCHDDADPYLVVAADKGTATFSDRANEIAGEYGFWLGDAFASGGSTGYDHKALGITARGVWESVRRHFGELGLDPDRDEFTAVGIGDMSGDVFGNGMLMPRVKLVAAFDHRHVFIDPDPDPAVAFGERQRLFAMPRSSWADYEPALISPGGGVYPRIAKAISLAPQARAALGTDAEWLAADELIRVLLRAPVDLLFNGGLGTYVKASEETHADAFDRANDTVRVDASELRARVVAEGGNLGLTQRARIEFALTGGRINTDFIDNSAGVDISDREVNIKILLDGAVAAGLLEQVRRNQLLREVAHDVAALTLADNYLQAQAISVTEALGTQSLDRLQQVMRYGETRQALDRAQEFLPTEKTIEERQAAGIGMTRPEIAVMLAYSKNLAQQTLLGTQALDDPYMDRAVAGYLPTTLRQEFAHLLPRHPMRRELTASMLNNELHNRAGSGILLRLQQLTLDASNHIRATVVARDVLNLPEIWAGIDALDLTRHAHDQVLLLIECRRVFEQAALWFLRNRREIDMAGEVGRFRPALRELAPRLRGFLPARQRAAVDQRIAGLIGNGVPEPLCERVFVLQALCSGMDIATIASAYDRELDWTAGLYFALGETLGLDWLERQLADRHGESHWTALAKTSLRDDLLTQNRWLAAAAVRNAHGQVAPEEAVAAWLTRNSDRVQLYRQTLASMEETAHPDVPMLSVAVQELRNLAQVGGAGAGP